MDIRLITEHDVEAYATLRLQGLLNHPEAFGSSYEEEKDRPLDDLRQRLKERSIPENFTLGAWRESNLIGMVGFYRETHLKMRHKGNIWGMYVALEARGQGIGRHLMEAILERVKNVEGLEQVNLTVVSTNAAARQLYLSLGFTIFGLESRALKIGEQYFDEEYMVLKLC
ncbi:MAG: GNAT family N-acetyltransferase [Anaerolineae bacterium]|nr:GNAT family N-acetyltransferase [Anaerolineae bacterium]